VDAREPETHSFIVKIWLEEAGGDAAPDVWRGHATHVPNGERLYFSRIDDIVTVIRALIERVSGTGIES
jgi:hypothetical protein